MLSPVRLSSVTLVRPTQSVQILGNVSTPFGTLAIRWHPRKILRRSSQGNPPSGNLNARGVTKCSDLGPIEAISRKRCKIGLGGNLITNRKSYMSFRSVDRYQNRWTWMTLNGVIFCVISPNSVASGGALRKSGWRFRRKKIHVRYLISWWVSCYL